MIPFFAAKQAVITVEGIGRSGTFKKACPDVRC
jgi:hypothetical protein